MRRHPEFLQGMRDTGSLAVGIGAWGLMTGVAMVQSGMSVFESAAMTLLVFAGSAQLAAIPLIVVGAPTWVIVATAFCVNLRFVVFSLHLRAYLMHLPRWQRLVHGYLTADMGYVLLTNRFPHSGSNDAERDARLAYLAGSNGLVWAAWMALSLAGVALANFIPLAWGLGFAGVLALIGVLLSMAINRLRILAIAIAGGTAVAAYALPFNLNVVVAIGTSVLLCYWVDQRYGVSPLLASKADQELVRK